MTGRPLDLQPNNPEEGWLMRRASGVTAGGDNLRADTIFTTLLPILGSTGSPN